MSVELIPNSRELRVFIDLVDGLPQVMAAAKDTDGHYLYVNRGFAERVGRRARDIIGRVVADLFAPELASSYAAQDGEILSTGTPLQGHLELIVRADGRLGWYLTSKTRLIADDGEVTGIAVMSVDLQSQMERLSRRTLGMAPRGVLQRLRLEHAVRLLSTTTLTAGEIASACGFYDQSSFTRQFRAVLGLTPGAYRRAS